MLFPGRASQKLPDGFALDLALDVPHGDLDGGERKARRPSAHHVLIAPAQILGDRFDVGWILPDGERSDRIGDGGDGDRHGGEAEGLSPTGDALVRLHLDVQRKDGLAAVAGRRLSFRAAVLIGEGD